MSLTVDVEDGVAVVTLQSPEKLNAMDRAMYGEITDAFRAIDADPKVRVGIVTGAGDKAFSAGADLKSVHGAQEPSEAEWRPWQADRWDLGAGPTKPMIAAINGYALAGGLELALLCDIRIASDNAQFGCPEVKWNLLHGYGAYRLPRIVGLSHAMEMMLTGEFISASAALEIGLVSRVVPRGEVLAEARDLALRIAANAPTAIRMTKDLVQRGEELSLENYMRIYRPYHDWTERSQEQRDRLGTFGDR